MAERKGNDRREVVIGFPDEFKNDYGEGCREPIITSCMEGPHGYSNIIGKDETPSGMFNYSGLTDTPDVSRNKLKK